MKMRILVFFSLLLSFSMSFADATADKCMKCHDGGDGSSPNLGAQVPDYLVNAMNEYKLGLRHSDDAKMMSNRMKKLDNATINSLAAFFSGRPAAAPVAGDATLMARGKDIYENGIAARGVESCVSCHGLNGEGKGKDNDGRNPRLAGQVQAYLAVQLANYAQGNMDPSSLLASANANDQQVGAGMKAMIDIAKKMQPDEMNAVAAYLQSK